MGNPVKIWMNKKFVEWDKARVHISTHSLNYGALAFEGIRFYNTEKGTALFRLDDHINRLFYSSSCIGINVPYSKEYLINTIKRLIKINKINQGYIRPSFFYGQGKVGVGPSGVKPMFVISIFPIKKYLNKKQLKVKISKFIRVHPKSTFADAKISGNYLNSILAILDVKKEGYDEALLLDYKGNIAEGSAENFFIIKNKVIYTPKLGNILDGITRKCILRVAKDLGYTTIEKNINPNEAITADEAFFTGTAIEVHPIKQINKTIIGNGKIGPITKVLIKTFSDIVRGKNKQYIQWLYPID